MDMRSVLPKAQIPAAPGTPSTRDDPSADGADVRGYKVIDRPPSDLLIEAEGDIVAAAAEAEVSKADFYRALGADKSIALSTKAMHFLALTSHLQIMNLTVDRIEQIFFYTDPSTADENEFSIADATDGNIQMPQGGPQGISMKELIKLLQVTGQFISESNRDHNPPAPRPSRFTPPKSPRAMVLEASRGRPPHPGVPEIPAPTGSAPGIAPSTGEDSATTDQEDDEVDEIADAFEEEFRAKLDAAPPEVRELFARAFARDDDDELD